MCQLSRRHILNKLRNKYFEFKKPVVHTQCLLTSPRHLTLPHERLLLKLDHVGIRGKLLTWISSFLLSRRQCVVIDGSSEWCDVTSGVRRAQSQVHYYLLYISMTLGKTYTPILASFADDCTISKEVTSYQDYLSFQDDLNSLSRWANKWQLALNMSKCKVMCISRK